MNLTFKLLLIFLLLPLKLSTVDFNPAALGGFAISVDLFRYILDKVEIGRPILELGSGSGTGELARYYQMYSIEHESGWLNKYDTHYIYAPIKNYGEYYWYDKDIVANDLPLEYDLILIDGPPGPIGRVGFLQNLHLFNTNVIMIFDDVQRAAELALLKGVAQKLRNPFKIIKCSDGKAFGVIN